jgi:putative inorganic carbon (HCO3(-)) transporter
MSRPTSGRWALFWGLLGLCLSLVLALMAMAISPWTGNEGQLPWVPQAVDKSLGVNVDLSCMDSLAREEALKAMQAAGLRWVRQRFPWDAIEPERGTFHWALWDEIVAAAHSHDLQLIAVLDGSPTWAQRPEDAIAQNPLAPPYQVRDFGDWAAMVAQRYGDEINHYEIWDEPNIAPHWGAREIDPEAYGRLLREGAIRIRAVDSTAVILAAALAPNVEPGGANMSDVDFLQALYRQGAQQWFDVVAAQVYDFGRAFDESAAQHELNWQRSTLLRQVMVAHGDEAAAVWAVSAGLAGASDRVSGERVAGAVAQVRREWPWLGPLLWAAWSPADVHAEYALVDAQGQPQTVYTALESLAKAPATAWPGSYPVDHPSGSYSGEWRVTPLGADIGTSGDRLAIRFQGTRLDLEVRRGDYRAFLFVTVDGQPANALPRDADGRAYVVLYDPLHRTESITLARDLAPGDHVAEIAADRGWGQWAIGGWRVAWRDPSLPAWLPALLGLASGFALLVSLGLAWMHRRRLQRGLDLLLSRASDLDHRLFVVVAAALAVLVYIMPSTLPSLIFLGLLGLALILRPGTGLLLVTVSLPFYQVGKPLLGKVFSMTEILTLATALAWVLHSILIDRQRAWGDRLKAWLVKIKWADWLVLGLVACGALSLTWAEESRVAAREFRTVVLESAVFYGLVRARVRRPWQAWQLADAWVLGGCLIATVGIGQWALGQDVITTEGVWRVRGFYGSPNNLALYLGRLLPVTVGILTWGKRGPRRWLYGFAAVLLAGALVLTYSRGAWLVGVPASLLFLAALRGRRTFVLAVGLAVLVAVLLLVAAGPGRLVSLLDTSQGTTFFRLQLWQSSLAMLGDHPIVGVGLDNFLYQYRSHYVLPTAWEEFNLSHPHNFVLDFWLRLGLAGLAILVWLLVTFFRQGWRLYRGLPEGSDRLLVMGLLAGMVNFVAHGLVDNAFFLVDLAFAFMLMLALIQVPYSELETQYSRERQQ